MKIRRENVIHQKYGNISGEDLIFKKSVFKYKGKYFSKRTFYKKKTRLKFIIKVNDRKNKRNEEKFRDTHLCICQKAV